MGVRFPLPAHRKEKSPRRRLFFSMSIFTTTLELTLSKIREKNNCPPRRSAGRAGTKQKNRLAGKKFPPLKPLHFLPARRKFFMKKFKKLGLHSAIQNRAKETALFTIRLLIIFRPFYNNTIAFYFNIK